MPLLARHSTKHRGQLVGGQRGSARLDRRAHIPEKAQTEVKPLSKLDQDLDEFSSTLLRLT